MEDFNTTWSNSEFHAYVLLHCAHADFIESNDEVDLIKSKVSESEYNHIHKEFDNDNDYQSIQKIMVTAKRLNYSGDQVEQLFSEMKELFLSDGEYGTLEHNLMLGLKHLLSK